MLGTFHHGSGAHHRFTVEEYYRMAAPAAFPDVMIDLTDLLA
jgi:hypothetical protein